MLSGGQTHALWRYAAPSDKTRAVWAPAHGAMAMDAEHCWQFDLELNCTAKTTSCYRLARHYYLLILRASIVSVESAVRRVNLELIRRLIRFAVVLDYQIRK